MAGSHASISSSLLVRERLARAVALAETSRIVLSGDEIIGRNGEGVAVDGQLLAAIPTTRTQLEERLSHLERDRREADFVRGLILRAEEYCAAALSNPKRAFKHLEAMQAQHLTPVFRAVERHELGSPAALALRDVLNSAQDFGDVRELQAVARRVRSELRRTRQELEEEQRAMARESSALQDGLSGSELLSVRELSRLYGVLKRLR